MRGIAQWRGKRGWWRSCLPYNEDKTTTTTTEEVKKRVHKTRRKRVRHVAHGASPQRENVCHGGILERKKHTLKWSHRGFMATMGSGLPNPETWGNDLKWSPKRHWSRIWFVRKTTFRNKLGVIALSISIAILFILLTNKSKFRGTQFYPVNQVLFWTITNTVILLTWIGARPVEDPYILTGQISTTIYFIYYILNPTITKQWDKITD